MTENAWPSLHQADCAHERRHLMPKGDFRGRLVVPVNLGALKPQYETFADGS